MGQMPLIIPAHVAEKALARAESCASCKWRYRASETGGDIECRRLPPTAHLNMVPAQQGPVARPGQAGMVHMQLQLNSTYSVVKDDWFCGEWAPKASAVS